MQVVTAPLWWVIFRIFSFILGILIFLVIFVAVVNVILALVGDPGRCDAAGRTIDISPANADAFQTKWDQFDDTLGRGQATTASFNESEITSRGRRYLEDENNTPIKDLLVCIRGGYGEASGSIDTPLGLNAKVKVKGTMDLTGAHPKAVIDDISIGVIPGFLVDPVKGWLEDLIDNQLDNINLHHRYDPALTEGNTEIKGTP
ncbi:MAG TPA: hypothetical protein VFT91_06625 [Dehalococcoidia bacterium]|nr:hypothetical protein [Dehalococcoidia bacterium]